jgi:hypothetical protein
MAEPHVVSALKAKRAELAGEIELTTVRLQQLRTALHSLDEPKVWRPKADWVQRGEVVRTCLETLRQATALLSTRDIALVLMTARGMDTDDARIVRLITKRVGCCLRGQRDQGRVVSEEGPGQTKVWRLA